MKIFNLFIFTLIVFNFVGCKFDNGGDQATTSNTSQHPSFLEKIKKSIENLRDAGTAQVNNRSTELASVFAKCKDKECLDALDVQVDSKNLVTWLEERNKSPQIFKHALEIFDPSKVPSASFSKLSGAATTKLINRASAELSVQPEVSTDEKKFAAKFLGRIILGYNHKGLVLPFSPKNSNAYYGLVFNADKANAENFFRVIFDGFQNFKNALETEIASKETKFIAKIFALVSEQALRNKLSLFILNEVHKTSGHPWIQEIYKNSENILGFHFLELVGNRKDDIEIFSKFLNKNTKALVFQTIDNSGLMNAIRTSSTSDWQKRTASLYVKLSENPYFSSAPAHCLSDFLQRNEDTLNAIAITKKGDALPVKDLDALKTLLDAKSLEKGLITAVKIPLKSKNAIYKKLATDEQKLEFSAKFDFTDWNSKLATALKEDKNKLFMAIFNQSAFDPAQSELVRILDGEKLTNDQLMVNFNAHTKKAAHGPILAAVMHSLLSIVETTKNTSDHSRQVFESYLEAIAKQIKKAGGKNRQIQELIKHDDGSDNSKSSAQDVLKLLNASFPGNKIVIGVKNFKKLF